MFTQSLSQQRDHAVGGGEANKKKRRQMVASGGILGENEDIYRLSVVSTF